MKSVQSNEHRRASRAIIMSCAVVLAVSGAAWLGAWAQPSAQRPAAAPASSQTPAPAREQLDLERAFWICDHAATHRGAHAVDAAGCSTITERFKQQRFGGDFEAMLAWWRENRAAQYRAIEAAARSSGGSVPAF